MTATEFERYYRCVCGAADHFIYLACSKDEDWPYCTLSAGVWAGPLRQRLKAAWQALTGFHAPLAWVELDKDAARQLATDLARYAEEPD